MPETGVRLEVEAKARCGNLAAVEANLAKMGAVLEANKTERDEYWAHPARDFGETDEALRLRVTTADDGGGWSRAELTYKGAKIDPDTKTRAEENVEVQLDQVEVLRKVLQGIGFRPFAMVTKDRREFELKGATVCLDKVEGVGEFVEVEIISDELEAAKARVMALFKELALVPNERRSYLELMLTEKKGH